MEWFRRGVLLNIVLQGIDGLSTFYVVKYCRATENNPLVLYFIESFGLETGLIILKTIAIVVLILFLKFYKELPKYLGYVLWLLNFVYAFLIGLNILGYF